MEIQLVGPKDNTNAAEDTCATADLFNVLEQIQKNDLTQNESDCLATALRGMAKLTREEHDALADTILMLTKFVSPEQSETVQKSDTSDGYNKDDSELLAALDTLSERVAAVEKTRGCKKSLNSQDGKESKKLMWPSLSS